VVPARLSPGLQPDAASFGAALRLDVGPLPLGTGHPAASALIYPGLDDRLTVGLLHEPGQRRDLRYGFANDERAWVRVPALRRQVDGENDPRRLTGVSLNPRHLSKVHQDRRPAR